MIGSIGRVAVLAAACLFALPSNTAVPLSAVPSGSVRSVAIINEVGQDVTHTNTGFTVFGDFEHKLKNDWDVPGFLYRSLEETLQREGIAVKPAQLSTEERTLVMSGKCYSKWNGRFKPACHKPLQDLLERLHVDALVTLQEYEITDGYNEKNNLVSGYGLLTHGTWDPPTSVVYAHISMDIFGGAPPQPLKTAGCISTEVGRERTWSKDTKELGINDLAAVRGELEALLKDRVKHSLAASGLTDGSAEECPLWWGRKR